MIELKRLPDWRKRLSEFLVLRPSREFEWGDDCVLGMVFPAILAMTGTDMGAEFRGRYDSEAGAAALIAELGHANLGDALAARLPEIHPSQAHIGDVAMVPTGGGGLFPEASGIVNGDRIMVLAPNGIASVNLMRAVRAFRVG